MASVNNHLRLLIFSDEVLGLYAYEPGSLMVALGEDEPFAPWFIKLVAISVEHHGHGFGGRLLETCLDELAEMDVGG